MGNPCEICNRIMLKAESCFDKDYIIDGKRYQALRYHNKFGEGERCHDCNCKQGEFHHTGCDNERCPSCFGQFISCDCEIDDEIVIFPKGRRFKL